MRLSKTIDKVVLVNKIADAVANAIDSEYTVTATNFKPLEFSFTPTPVKRKSSWVSFWDNISAWRAHRKQVKLDKKCAKLGKKYWKLMKTKYMSNGILNSIASTVIMGGVLYGLYKLGLSDNPTQMPEIKTKPVSKKNGKKTSK